MKKVIVIIGTILIGAAVGVLVGIVTGSLVLDGLAAFGTAYFLTSLTVTSDA